MALNHADFKSAKTDTRVHLGLTAHPSFARLPFWNMWQQPLQGTHPHTDHCPAERTGTILIGNCHKPLTCAVFQKSKLCFLGPFRSRQAVSGHSFTILAHLLCEFVWMGSVGLYGGMVISNQQAEKPKITSWEADYMLRSSIWKSPRRPVVVLSPPELINTGHQEPADCAQTHYPQQYQSLVA